MFQSTPSQPLYHIILLRHGESVGNAEGKHQGQADFPMTERGRLQAGDLAKCWKEQGKKPDLVISSPLLRARETAEIISTELSIPLELNPLWMERNNGLLAGLRPEDARQRYPRPPFIHPYQAIGENGESQWELYLRAGQAVQSLLDHPAGFYLVVSHGGILNMVLYAILGIVPQANFYGPRFRFNNTAYTTLTYHPGEHKWNVLGVNEHSHLESGHWQEE